jgi:hypothetical protein
MFWAINTHAEPNIPSLVSLSDELRDVRDKTRERFKALAAD